MNPRLLKTFQAIARHRNITRAAGDLHLSQSAVSDQIQALETELGVRLFDRSRGGLELTPAGETFTVYAEELISLSLEARSAVASTAGYEGGNLTIGTLETIAKTKLPAWLAMFRERHRQITISLNVAASGDLIQQVEAAEIDVGFCFNRGNFDDRLATRLVAKEPLVLIAPIIGHFVRQYSTFTDLGSAPLMATEVGCVYRALFDQAFTDAGMKPPTPVIAAGSIDAIAKLVESGAGIAVVPRLAVEDALEGGKINEIAWPGPIPSASLVMVWRRRRVQPPALNLLLAAVTDGLRPN